MSLLQKFQEACLSSREVALLRIDSLGRDIRNRSGIRGTEKDDNNRSIGLANDLVGLLQEAIESSDIPRTVEIVELLQTLGVTDVTLIEEVSVFPGFRQLLRDLETNSTPEFRSLHTPVAQLQSLLSQLATVDKSEPFTHSEVQSRLPLVFGIPQPDDKSHPNSRSRSNLQIMVHLVTSEEETGTHDTGFVMWPSSLLLSRHIANHPDLIINCATSTDVGYDAAILELGAGCGLVGLTAATILKQFNEESKEEEDIEENSTSVILTDYCSTVLENISRNLHLNDVAESCEVAGLDFFDQPGNDDSKYEQSERSWIDTDGTKRPQVDLILAADIIVYSNDATNVANTIHAGLLEGGKAIVVSESRRFGVEAFPQACRDAGLEITTENVEVPISSFDTTDTENDTNHKKLLAHDMDQTSLQGIRREHYHPVMFTIDKPMASS